LEIIQIRTKVDLMNDEKNQHPCGHHLPSSLEKNGWGRFSNVYFYLTGECQLTCKHCYLGDRLHTKACVPLDRAKKLLTFFHSLGGSKLSILGGEPTLHEDFCSICLFAKKTGFGKIILNTNGLDIAKEKILQMDKDVFDYIQVSIDGGSSQTHDQIRGQGTFAISWRNIRSLIQNDRKVWVVCTVSKTNSHDALDLIEMCEDFGVKCLKYHIFSPIGQGKKNHDMAISPKEWIAFYEEIEKRKISSKIPISYQPAYAYSEKAQKYYDQGYQGCLGKLLDRISVFPDGDVYVCSYLFDTSINMFYLDDEGMKIHKGPNEFDLFAKFSEKNIFCPYGECPAEKFLEKNYPLEEGIIPICRLWRTKE
jgi:MoaA/NifB/PqqE/SkfB family radical SAM enzyme